MIHHVEPSEETVESRKVAALQVLMTEYRRTEAANKRVSSEFNEQIRDATAAYEEEALSPIPTAKADVATRLKLVQDGVKSVRQLKSDKKAQTDVLKARSIELDQAISEVLFASKSPQQEMFGSHSASLGFVITPGTKTVLDRVLGEIMRKAAESGADDDGMTEDQSELYGILGEMGAAGLRLVDDDAEDLVEDEP